MDPKIPQSAHKKTSPRPHLFLFNLFVQASMAMAQENFTGVSSWWLGVTDMEYEGRYTIQKTTKSKGTYQYKIQILGTFPNILKKHFGQV